MAEITLDRTLRDLYELEGDDAQHIFLVYAVPIAEIQMSRGVPPSRKFSYQSPLLPTGDSDILAREFLQLAPQLLGFIAGRMPLILFDLDKIPEETHHKSCTRQHQLDAHGVFDRLTASQRPTLAFVAKPEDIICTENTQIAQVNPMDCMELLPQLVKPENHYKVLSKRTLAFSGIPTPVTTVLEVDLSISQLSNSEAIDAEVERIFRIIKSRNTPFILKLPQSLSGQGTFIVRTEEDRNSAIGVLEPEIRRMITQISYENVHLKPCSVILQEMIPGEAIAVSFFVTRSGKAIFNACCSQLVDTEGNWGGGFIDYSAQESLAVKYKHTLNTVASYLHDNGYWGPAGIDIISDEEGMQLVIDMNVRVTGSHPLGVLRGFFGKQGLNVATLLFPFMVNGTRVEFENAFRQEVNEGRLVTIAWVHEREGKTSMSTIILAAPHMEELHKFRDRVKEWEIKE